MLRAVVTVKFTIGTLRCHNSEDNDNFKKINTLKRQNNNSARTSRFYAHFFPATARLGRENAYFHVLWRT